MRRWSVLGITALVVSLPFVLAACGSQSGGAQPADKLTAAASLPTTRPTGAATSLPVAVAPAGSGCFADLPAYPGAKEDKAKDADLDGVIKFLGGQRDWFPAESHVYMTGDTPDQVLQYYGNALPSRGWKQTSRIPGKNWGFVLWNKANAQAQLLAGTSDGQTTILLGCSVTAPTPTPLVAQKLTLKQSFDLLRQQTALSDLAFYSYRDQAVDEGGKTANYTVSGYSKAQKRSCYFQANGKIVKVTCADQASASGPLVEDMNKLKDSSELLAEAAKKYPSCPGGVTLEINLTQSKAQVVCSGSKWSADLSPYK